MVNPGGKAVDKPEAGSCKTRAYGECLKMGLASPLSISKPRRNREDFFTGVSLKRMQKTSVFFVVSPARGLKSGFWVSSCSGFPFICVYVRQAKTLSYLLSLTFKNSHLFYSYVAI